MLSRRIKYAMDHLSHKQYTDLLAQPNWRRIRRINVNILSNPFTTRRSALKARASKRIKVMARPKYITKKYDPEKAPPPFPRIHPKILAATSSRRINDLALPTKRLLLSNLVFQTSGNIVEMLWKAQNSRYIRYRYFCNARQQREAKRKQKIMARLRKAIKPDDWDRHVEILKKLATPKVPPKPKFFDRRKKWRPVNVRRLEELSTPVVRELPDVRDPFTVSQAALTYKITTRLQKIAYPKTVPEIIPPQIPGTVSPAALRAIASPRTIMLSKPVERPAGMETHLREDAFTVSPKALKARCTRRLRLLARPKTYRR
ncbi:testicular haploid expressed gene [Calliopsis andreniformis]|uniref:testicular haploid expressed gene n=1 Tax=Calliopsis andreniformis TaxID=337506 RepID=UPI003FCEAF80